MRQQKRAVERAAAKAKTRKAPGRKKPDTTTPILDNHVKRLKAEDLSDLQVAAAELARSVNEKDNRNQRQVLDDERVWYVRAPKGKENGRRIHDVTRRTDNDRGTLRIAYACDCQDFAKNGFNGCVHTVAERIVRGEIVIVGKISDERVRAACAQRRAERKRVADDGQSVRTTQRDARTRMPREIPRLITSLRKAYEREIRANAVAAREGNLIVLRHRPPTAVPTRAACLLHKIAVRRGCDGMRAEFERLIDDGMLPGLLDPPHPNTMTDWFQCADLTPVLERWLVMSAYAFHRREVGAIIDSSKVSQMRTAHHRGVEYQGDEREGAQWMRCHVIVGVETMVVMAARFGPNRGIDKTADANYLKPLVSAAKETFSLHYLLGDKAYWGRPNTEWLWDEAHIRAVVPAKKNTIREPGRGQRRREMFDPYWDLIKWQDEAHVKEFHEIYRLRPKIEGFFSLLKRCADEQMWSRGRRHKDGTFDPMRSGGPCTAWVNEALCKMIYMNLRATVTLEEETGIEIDYGTPGRCFPPPLEPLINIAA